MVRPKLDRPGSPPGEWATGIGEVDAEGSLLADREYHGCIEVL
jgi:hypothetical protein